MVAQKELPIIQKTCVLTLWFVSHLNKLLRDYKFALGNRIQAQLQAALEGLIRARYAVDKLAVLEALNMKLQVVRYQTRLCLDLDLLDVRRHEHAGKLINEIGENLGGWIRQQAGRT